MRILDSKSIEYKLVDISQGEEVRDEMRNKSGNPTAVPPQLFNEDQYCGVRIGKKKKLLKFIGTRNLPPSPLLLALLFSKCVLRQPVQ